MAELFPGFEERRIATEGAEIFCRIGGEGPPLLLLHGYPQTGAMWHKVASALAAHFSLVIADLRGYGRSAKPETTADHAPYAKRAMAQDMAEVMTALGHERFFLAGHDRGGRVAHRLALDHAERVARLAVLDIAPTREMYRNTDEAFARAYWHWFYLIRPAPMPERMIGADPEAFLNEKLSGLTGTLENFDERALAEYLDGFRNPATIHASCEDYRAAATIDLAHDDADGSRKVACPLLVLWGLKGVIERCFDPLALWRERAEQVEGFGLPCSHYLAEELPDATAKALSDFFAVETTSL